MSKIGKYMNSASQIYRRHIKVETYEISTKFIKVCLYTIIFYHQICKLYIFYLNKINTLRTQPTYYKFHDNCIRMQLFISKWDNSSFPNCSNPLMAIY